MEERLAPRRASGIDRNTLRLWGMIIVACGLLSRGILQARVLGMGTIDPQQLLELMQASSAAMNAATAALVMQAIESMAVSIFVLLTVDGFERTASVKNYLLRMAALAVVSEVPYNFAMSGKFIDASSRNPVFGLVLVLAMLYLMRYFSGMQFGRILLKVAVFAAAWVWAAMLGVVNGRSMVVIAALLWAFRGRHLMSLLFASAGALSCCIGDPLFMFAPMGFLIAHFYNGEQGASPRWLQYALYPVLLILVGVVGVLLF